MSFGRLAAATTPTAHIGLGLAAVGRPAYLTLGRERELPEPRTVDAMRRRTHELLDAAYAQGVRYVDAARSYGRAEEFLAEWLEAHPEASDLVVGSKWGYTYVGEWRTDVDVHEVKDHSAEAFSRQVAESRELLGDRLDLYQIHSLTPESPAVTDTALHGLLAELAAEGTTIGLSTSGPAQADAIRAALRITSGGEPLFRTVQATWNLLEPSAGEALAEAHAAGLTVLVKEPLANGRLAGEAAPPEVREAAEGLAESPDTVALAAVLQQPWAGVVLSGAATVEELASNLRAVTDPESQLPPGVERLAEEPGAYWAHRAELPWN